MLHHPCLLRLSNFKQDFPHLLISISYYAKTIDPSFADASMNDFLLFVERKIHFKGLRALGLR